MNLPRHRRTTDARPEQQLARLDAAELGQLASVFAPPRWLRDLGRASWLLVGVAALIAALIWLLGKTSVIVGPVLVGLVVATVAAPLVTALHRRRLPRAVGALVVLLGLVALGVLVLVLVLAGITAQSEVISEHATAAADKAEAWLKDAGVDSDGSSSAKENVSSAVPGIISTLTRGVLDGIEGITSLAFGLSFAVFSIFFLLKDGPKLRRWVEHHLGVPRPVAQVITGDVITSVRRYFLGVTIVAAFNGTVVGLGALFLGVPLAGTIAVVTLVTAYVPFIGAFVSGAFAVVLALGAEGTSTALIMLVIVLLANGMLQNIVQPFALGATLSLNPLLILVVTIGAGSLFGMVGMVLAAPLTSALVHITADLAHVRGVEQVPEEAETSPAPGDAPPVPA